MNKLVRLENVLRDMGPVAVAVSGGVDSMTLAVVAHRVNPDSQIFHAQSAAVPHQATARVKQYARQEGWHLTLINAGEADDPDYVANPVNRCYFCKTNLYRTVCEQTQLLVVSGTNLDDLGDYRPGLVAAAEHQVRHPYVEACISKAQLREIASSLNLHDLKDLPAAPCLSSRVTTGIAINEKLLPVINAVEQRLQEQIESMAPLSGVRCRIRRNQVAIELDTPNFKAVLAQQSANIKALVIELFTQHQFSQYLKTVTIEPYKRGSAFLIETRAVEAN